MKFNKSVKPEVYSYRRFSDMEQKKGNSLERQEDYASRVATQYGLELNQELIFTDVAMSAFRAEHKRAGAYGIFLKAVQQGLVSKGSFLIVENFDRLSRENARTAQTDIYELIEAGINIITATDGQIYSKQTLDLNPSLLFLMTATMIRAHEESLTKQKRSIASIQTKVAKFRGGEDVDVGGPTPFWVKRLPKGSKRIFELNDYSQAAKLITTSYLKGCSFGKIQEKLLGLGIDAPKGGKSWGQTTISNVLESEALFGRKVVRHTSTADGTVGAGEYVLDNYYPAIISENDFDLIQQIKKLKKRGKAGYRVNKSGGDDSEDKGSNDTVVYLLSGYGTNSEGHARSVCSKCMGALGSRTQKQMNRKGEYTKTVMRLDCLNRTRKKRTCDAKGIAQRELERSFLQAVHEHVDYSLLNTVDSNARAVEVIDSKIEDLKVLIRRSTDLILYSESEEVHNKAKAALRNAEKEISELEEQKKQGKDYIISSNAIQEFKSYVMRAYDIDNDIEARSYVKNILLQSVEKLVVDSSPRTIASLGYKNIYKDSKFWTVTVEFRSKKRITIYHDCVKNMSLFNMIEGGSNTQHAFTPEALKIWDEHGDEALVRHLADVGLGASNYVDGYISALEPYIDK
ncbi:TPA: recombinase family protein [Vibrio harveyi]